MAKNDFLVAITQLAAEKNLPKEVVFDAVEAALASAYKKDTLATSNVVVKIDPETGTTRVFTRITVVEEDEIEDPETEVNLEDGRKLKPGVQLGDGIDTEVEPQYSGRVAAQTAKQVVLQRLREAEREVVFDEYSNREGDIVSGEMVRMEGRNVIIDLGKAEALLPASEQVRIEHYRSGQRLKYYVLEVYKAAKGPQVIVSRTHKNVIRRLFELEVPEIFKGTVEIKAIAREAGFRSKVAVWSMQEGVDPVGACVGLRGIRIQNIVNELNGERIDVVLWDPDPGRFVAHALSPAQVVHVQLDEETNTAEVVVPDRQLSLAIGKEGQNARLAAKLTGRRIDIKSQSIWDEFKPPDLEPSEEEKVEEGAAEPTAETPAVAVAEEPVEAAPEPEAAAPAEEEVAEPAVAAPAASTAQPVSSKLRFAEDVLPQGHTDPGIKTRGEAEEAAEKAKRSRKPRRLRPEEEEDDDQLDYTTPADDED